MVAAKTEAKERAATPAPEETTDARIDEVLERQRAFFRSGATLPRQFRVDQLRALLETLRAREQDLLDALHSDLRKPPFEAYGSEIGFLYAELRHTIKHLGKWMKPESGFSPLVAAPSRSYVHYQPRGLNLIVGAWNYPVQLSLAPVIGAIAAGNVAVIKPSELTPASSAIVADVIRQAFSEEFVAVLEGGVETAQRLLARKWDHIFFTGGTQVGRIVAKAAAEHLTPTTLELGGKSPAVVMPSADLDVAAKRLVWGKFFNAGQTCVAPDYILAHDSIHDALIERMKAAIEQFYGADPQQSPDYARIVNERHFQRLVGLIEPSKVVAGGESDAEDRYIAPTLMRDVTEADKAMQDEIFGPVLPFLPVGGLDEAVERIRQHPNPLSLYLFTGDKGDEEQVVERVSFGGGCVNNTMMHLSDPKLPFGGVGASGMGAYHGKHSFEVFSHRKSVMKTATFIDPDLRYAPYEGKMGIARRLIK